MPSIPKNIIDFANPQCPETKGYFDDLTVVNAPYESKSWRHFSDSDKGALAGIWEAPAHLHRCEFTYTEMCHVLQGSIRLTDSEGSARTFGPGDSFVVQKGFKGVWENLSDVRKVYFIMS